MTCCSIYSYLVCSKLNDEMVNYLAKGGASKETIKLMGLKHVVNKMQHKECRQDDLIGQMHATYTTDMNDWKLTP